MKYDIKNLTRVLLVCGMALGAEVQNVSADANPPNLMSYQGYLEDSSGKAIATTPENYDVIFRIYENEQAADGEEILWSEKQTVTFDNGIFSVLLGAGTQYSDSEPYPDLSEVFDNLGLTTGDSVSSRYIGITVLDLPDGDDSELAPRLRLLSSPYSFLAGKALVADKLSDSNFSLDTSGNVTVSKQLKVTGISDFDSAVTIKSFTSEGNSSVAGDLEVTTFESTGAATIGGTLNTANVDITGSLDVSGTIESDGRLFVYSTEDAADDNLNGSIFVGSTTGVNLGIDDNQIQARDASGDSVVASELHLNSEGGDVIIGNSADNTTIRGVTTFSNETNFSSESTFNANAYMEDTLVLGNDTYRGGSSIGSTNNGVHDHLQFKTDGGSRWQVGMDTDSGNGDDDLFFLYYNGSSWNAIGWFDPDGNIKEASDIRFKKNIEKIENGVLEKLMQMSAVRFHKNEDANDAVKKFGFIAQDVQKVFPDFVDEEEGYLGLPYAKFGVLAIAGLQELKTEKDEQIGALQTDVQALKQQNAFLMQQLQLLQEKFESMDKRFP